jgi:hypothetical protein
MKGGWHPLPRLMSIVLSNGATIRVLTSANRTRPAFLNSDMLNHSMWLKDSAAPDEDNKKDTADFSKFYKKFGYDDEKETKSGRTSKTKLFR